ncbi:MAG: hypothetical protein RMY64_30655 [Nostoc sp. DedQUE08]|nr:hypothetical protein [Nostoc sp. DedQUE08]
MTSIVRNLPKVWIKTTLGHCVRLINGRAYLRHELLTAGTPITRIQNLNGGNNWFYSDLVLPNEKYCDAGDLLFAVGEDVLKVLLLVSKSSRSP